MALMEMTMEIERIPQMQKEIVRLNNEVIAIKTLLEKNNIRYT